MKIKTYYLLLFPLLIMMFTVSNVQAVPEGWGQGWSDYSRLATASQTSPAPIILQDSKGDLLVFWLTKDESLKAKYMKLNSLGEVLVKPTQITNDPILKSQCFQPFIDANDQIVVFYGTETDDTYNLNLAKFTAGANPVITTLIPFERVFTNLRGVQDSKGDYHLFLDNTSSKQSLEIYHYKFAKDFTLLINNNRLTTDTAASELLNVAIDSQDRLHIILNDNPDGLGSFGAASWSIKYMVIDKYGQTLKEGIKLEKSMDYAENVTPEIIVDHTDQVYIFWPYIEKTGWMIKNIELIYTIFDADLNQKFAPIQVSDHQGEYAWLYPPKAYIDNTNQVHLVWSDGIDVPMHFYYTILKDDQIIQPRQRLTLAESVFWLPTLTIDQNQNKHLFFMEIIQEGKSSLNYMNTVKPARVTYWNRFGVDEDHLLSTGIYRLSNILVIGIIATILGGIPITVGALALSFYDRHFRYQHIWAKTLVLISTIFCVQLLPLDVTVQGPALLYRCISLGVATLVVYVWLYYTRNRASFKNFVGYLLAGFIWVLVYSIIMLTPVTGKLAGIM